VICAHCRKKIRSAKAELLWLLPNGREVGLHPACEEKYNGYEEEE
jgi:hypothetical protein